MIKSQVEGRKKEQKWVKGQNTDEESWTDFFQIRNTKASNYDLLLYNYNGK